MDVRGENSSKMRIDSGKEILKLKRINRFLKGRSLE